MEGKVVKGFWTAPGIKSLQLSIHCGISTSLEHVVYVDRQR